MPRRYETVYIFDSVLEEPAIAEKHETARQAVPGVRIRRTRAGLQGRPYPEPIPHRAREDPAEPVVGDVRAASASARDGDQARSPARPPPLHQGLRRLT